MLNFSTYKPTFLFDGGFGTYYSQFISSTDYCERANLSHPNLVYRIHKEYLEAGANAIKTNTFGVNSLLFDQEEISQIISSGYQIALSATEGTDAKVFADIGYINLATESTPTEYLYLADLFISCGAKHFLFETLAEYEVILPAVEHIKRLVPDAYIIVSFAVTQDGYTQNGHYYKDLLYKASTHSAINTVGLNCICGPSHILNLIKSLDLQTLSFSAMPNAGYPATINGRIIYRDNAEYFSQKLVDIAALGVTALGGCCGTTPEHIRLTIQKLADVSTPSFSALTVSPAQPQSSGTIGSFEKLLSLSKKTIAVELDPPINTDCTHILSAAKLLKEAGADIITVADSPLARTRADSILLAAKIKREIGIEVLPHLSCRDKNHIGIKGSLLGANIEGVHNILAITGDPVAQTDRGHCKGVFNFNSFNLISFINSLNSEVFTDTPFYIGGALNVNTPQFEHELNRAMHKKENGANFFLTQPLFSEESVANLHLAYSQLDCKILAGILPFASYRNALFLNNEVSGITIPDEVLASVQDKTPEEVIPLSIAFSSQIINQCFDSCDGFYLMTPLKKTELICELIKQIRKLESEKIN
ncbi:MAG: bifunctional homocysteine S-methyltransferase/methylenetetrahydrofolate reductase [Cellulosilyticaceae bacterium]